MFNASTITYTLVFNVTMLCCTFKQRLHFAINLFTWNSYIKTVCPILSVWLISCVWFSSNVLLCIMTKHYFGLICPKDTGLEVLWFVQMQLKLCCQVLFNEKRLSLINLPNKPYFFIFFLHCPVMNFNCDL